MIHCPTNADIFLDTCMIHAVWIQRWSGHNPRTNIRFHFWYIFNIVGIFLKKKMESINVHVSLHYIHMYMYKDSRMIIIMTKMIIIMTNALAKGRFLKYNIYI